MKMLAEHGWQGVGAGAFRHHFPKYIRHTPVINTVFWSHLHDDWLEIPIELGATGMGIIFLGAGFWLLVFIRRRTLWHSPLVALLFGCGATLMHAWYDFPFQNPAILITWCVLLTVSARGLELESARRGESTAA